MSLKEKSSKIDFSVLPAASSGVVNAGRAKTAPGALLAHATEMRSELLQENEALKVSAAKAEEYKGEIERLQNELVQWDGAKAARRLDPRQVRRSKWANRIAESFRGEGFEAFKREIESAGGNVQPIKVRPLGRTVDGARFEVVFGHRRLQACLELGLPVLAVIDSISDIDLFVDMDRENRQRADLSAWEQGCMYVRALEDGLFPSAKKLSEAVGADLTNVGRAIRLARLPQEVVAAFESPLDLQFRFAQKLSEAVERDREGVLRLAREIAAATPRPGAKAVFERLCGEARESVSAPVVLMFEGKRVGEVNRGRDGAVTVRFEAGVVSPSHTENLRRSLLDFLSRAAGRA